MEDQSIGNDVTMRSSTQAVLGRIDQYELLKELGGGGFGTVYLARDTVSGVEVAVKGLPPLVKSNKEELENIRANFALVSRLHHPNIAAALVLHPVRSAAYAARAVAEKLRVFEGDTLMVMEYAPGVTLSQWRRQFPDGKVPVAETLEIVRQIADALDYAHAAKIIHRDIKPSNVMVETRDKVKGSGEGEGVGLVVRVLDFGLAAEVRSSMGRVSHEITDTSGTRPYMAPEQWLGKKQDAATDQYALAVLAYELLTGEVPFASVFETGDPVVMMNVVGREPPEFSRELPRSMRRAFEIALDKDSTQRFTSCAAFAAALGGTRAAASAGRARTRAAPRWIAFGALVLLALAGVGGYVMWQHNEAEIARQAEAARQAELARQAEDKRQAEAEAKAKAEAEARIAAEKQQREDEQKRLQAEAERAAEVIVFDLSSKAASAHALMDAEKEEFKTFFATEIRAFENARRAGDDAKKNARYIVATNLLTCALAKATALGEAKAQCQECQNALAAAERARMAAAAVGADTSAQTSYDSSRAEMASAQESFERRRFVESVVAAKRAEKCFGELRTNVIAGTLEVARSHKTAARWQECLNAAENILSWEPGHPEAKLLKDEANGHLTPSLRIVAKIGDREVPAVGMLIPKKKRDPSIRFPFVVEKLQQGETWPHQCDMEITYCENEKRYAGVFKRCRADWRGQKTVVVSLTEETLDSFLNSPEALKRQEDGFRMLGIDLEAIFRNGPDVDVGPGADLGALVKKATSGTTFRLDAGEYKVPDGFSTYENKCIRIVGRSPSETVICGSGRIENGFDEDSALVLENVDIRVKKEHAIQSCRYKKGGAWNDGHAFVALINCRFSSGSLRLTDRSRTLVSRCLVEDAPASDEWLLSVGDDATAYVSDCYFRNAKVHAVCAFNRSRLVMRNCQCSNRGGDQIIRCNGRDVLLYVEDSTLSNGLVGLHVGSGGSYFIKRVTFKDCTKLAVDMSSDSPNVNTYKCEFSDVTERFKHSEKICESRDEFYVNSEILKGSAKAKERLMALHIKPDTAREPTLASVQEVIRKAIRAMIDNDWETFHAVTRRSTGEEWKLDEFRKMVGRDTEKDRRETEEMWRTFRAVMVVEQQDGSWKIPFGYKKNGKDALGSLRVRYFGNDLKVIVK